MRVVALLAQRVHHRVGDAADMGVGRARRDDEEVGRIAHWPQVEHHQPARLAVLGGLHRLRHGAGKAVVPPPGLRGAGHAGGTRAGVPSSTW